MDTMMPYLHFTGGDNLFFKSWRPSSNGAIAGASIALVVLAISERLLSSIRGAMEARWRRRYGSRHSFVDFTYNVGSALST
jgi:copper transporter 1